jgi:thymidylate synthase (FAD)
LRIVIPPHYRHDEQAIQILRSAAEHAAQAYEQLVAAAPKKKTVTEAARDVLPHMIETALVMTGNLRAWYEFFEKRLAPGADAEIREVARRCLAVAKTVAPTVFAGFEEAGGENCHA